MGLIFGWQHMLHKTIKNYASIVRLGYNLILYSTAMLVYFDFYLSRKFVGLCIFYAKHHVIFVCSCALLILFIFMSCFYTLVQLYIRHFWVVSFFHQRTWSGYALSSFLLIHSFCFLFVK